MTVQFELGHLITLGLAFIGLLAAFAKVLLAQIDKRFDATELLRKEATTRHDDEFKEMESQLRDLTRQLPNEYVRREDWIRFSATMDAKLDTLHRKIDSLVEKVHARG